MTISAHRPLGCRIQRLNRSFRVRRLPASEKASVAWTTAEANRGYLGVGKEMLYDGKPDLKETFECGHEADPDHRNLWPSESAMPDFRKVRSLTAVAAESRVV